MTRRILAIFAILLLTTAAWMILGSNIFHRTYRAGENLSDRVSATWGGPQQQTPPSVVAVRTVTKSVTTTENGTRVDRIVQEDEFIPQPLEQSRINAAIDLEQRQKGLLWFATYRVAFHGHYLFRNSSDSKRIQLRLSFPASAAIYDDLIFRVNGKNVPLTNEEAGVVASIESEPGSVIPLEVGYKSQGQTSWYYSFADHASQVHDFAMQLTTNFKAIDFPDGTLSPTTKRATSHGWVLDWNYTNLVTGFKIGMVMPEKLQPGPLAARISFFAPVSLLFFFFILFMITELKRIDLHPMNYFFLAAAFFAFHLLLAYLVDHISIHLAFVICSAVSIFLVVSYLRLVAGLRFALVEAAISQFVYLVLFSYAFFFDGFTGLAVTIGAIITLFVVMQLTGRVRWTERYQEVPA